MEIQRSATVVFSCPIVGQAYAKQGTTMETRLTVIDKIVPNNPEQFANCLDKAFSLSDLLNAITQFVPISHKLRRKTSCPGRLEEKTVTSFLPFRKRCNN